MYYLSLRKVLIRNQSGTHDQIIPANKPTFVIPNLYDAANAAGCVQCDENGKVGQLDYDAAPEVAANVAPAPAPAPLYSIEDVKAAVEAVIAVNNKADFNSTTGRPKVAPVAKVLGHKPTADEVNAAWEMVEAG